MALRIKSQWFRDGAGKTPEQKASAMAFIVWRVAGNMLKQTRAAGFDIDIGQPYFAFTREALVFLAQCADRLVFPKLQAEERQAFVVALVLRLAEIIQDNEDHWLGPVAEGEPGPAERFIALYNALADHYAEFGWGEDGPEFALVRYFGHRIELLMSEADRRWVMDHVMAVEVPQAVEQLRKAVPGVLGEARPRRARAAVSGE